MIDILIERLEPLAQLAEHLTFNQRVRGSNPRWLTRHRPSGNGRPFAYPVCRYGRGAPLTSAQKADKWGTLALPLPPFVSRFLHEGHVLTQYSRSAAALSLWTLSRLATLRNPGHTAAHKPTETIISGKIDGVFLSDNQRIMYAMFWFEIFLHTVSENHIAAL